MTIKGKIKTQTRKKQFGKGTTRPGNIQAHFYKEMPQAAKYKRQKQQSKAYQV